MAKRSRTIGILFLGALLAAGAGAGWWIKGYPERSRAGDGAELELVVEPGASLAAIAERLHDRGVVDHPRLFRLYAMRRGAATKIRAGAYTLRDDMAPREVVDALVEGVGDPSITVTIPEGYHILEIIEVLDEAGVADGAELEALAFDPAFLEARGIEGPSAEGYLFPDTYQFQVATAAEQVLDRMIEHQRRVWSDLLEENAESYDRLREELGWSERDFITMASIVEKEAVMDEERPRIAQVFFNRLTLPHFRPRLLQTDPTIRYGCMVPLDQEPPGCAGWTPGDRLRRRQLDDANNPYNTYQREGLPPGPICSPGRAALEAAIAPDGSDYLFFVSRNDGSHVFSRSLSQHNRAVDRYQRQARGK